MHLHAAPLGVGRQRQREVERMDLEALRIVQPLEVARGGEQGAHLVGLPGLERRAELFGQRARSLGEVRPLVGARDREPAPAHQDVGSTHLLQRGAHDLHAALRLGVELAGMVLAQLLDQGARAQRKARPDEAAVAARGAPADALALDQHHLQAAHGQQARGVQAGKAPAHDRNVCRDPAVQAGALRSGISRGGIPACGIVGVGHVR